MNALVADLPPNAQQWGERLPSGWGGRWYGVVVGLVVDIKDADGQGRVKITLPWSPDAGGARYEAWARLATLFGGNNRGSWFVPDVDGTWWHDPARLAATRPAGRLVAVPVRA